MRILLTGVTGGFGQMLVLELNKRGVEVVCLIRLQSGETADSRLAKLVAKLGLNKELVSCVPGDIREHLCGVSPEDIYRLVGRVDTVIHSAAIVKFDEVLRREILESNVGGTAEALNLAKELGVPHFTYISTAYVAGGADRFTEDDIDKGQELRNPYEESKVAAEKLVHAWSKENEVPALFLRLSILVGCSTDGFTTTFDAFYGFYAGFALIRDSVIRRIKEGKSGSDLFPARVEDGKVAIDLPVVFPMGSACTINLIQLDWVADISAKMVMKGSAGTYFLSHPEPLTIRAMTSHILERFGFRGFSYREPWEPAGIPSDAQKKLEPLLTLYRPYISHEAVFVARNAERELGGEFVPPPKTDTAFLDVLIDYAEKEEWGK